MLQIIPGSVPQNANFLFFCTINDSIEPYAENLQQHLAKMLPVDLFHSVYQQQ
jgi:hypothetical protein